MKQWLLLLLCVVMTAGVMARSAGAAEPTKKCTNLENEGVEYFSKITVIGSDVSLWRQNLLVYAVDRDNPMTGTTPNYKGTIVGMDIEVTDDDTRYSCTINEENAGKPTMMSCNSIPVNAIINGVYFIYKPESNPPGTPVRFIVESNYDKANVGKGKVLHGTDAAVALPPFPCARNILERDFEAAKNKSLVLYSNDGCDTGYKYCKSPLTCKTYENEKKCSTGLTCKEYNSDGTCKTCSDNNPPTIDVKICAAGLTCKEYNSDGTCKTCSNDNPPTEDKKSNKCTTCSDDSAPTVTTPSISDQVLYFYEKYEQSKKYAIVNLMHEDHLVADRVFVDVYAEPEIKFDYKLTLTFGYHYDPKTGIYGDTADVIYSYDPKFSPKVTIDATELNGLGNGDLPLYLIGGNISEVNKLERLEPDEKWAGTVPFPSSVYFNIRFWYENESGTLGYENSVFHFIRDLNFKFASTCSQTAEATGLYDYCLSSTQTFLAKFDKTQVIYDGTGTGKGKIYFGRNKVNPTGAFKLDVADGNPEVKKKNEYEGIFKSQSDPIWQDESGNKKAELEFWFMTWKCVDAACEWTTSTSAYPSQLVMSDGGGSSRTFTARGGAAGKSAMTSYMITPYYWKDASGTKAFAIREMVFAAPEPGTYVIYAFIDYDSQHDKTVPDVGAYWKKIYVTVNETDDIFNCYSRANNGYFKAWWNDCLSPSETQLIRFEHILNTEEAWIMNHSGAYVDYPFIAEFSYLPQKLEVASLNCKFEAIDGKGRPADGYCNHYNIHVPPYTKVTVTGGTMYMSGYPKHDEYRAAYVREDTLSISHLIFSIGVEQCEKKKIPDTGLSLRSPMSPLKINEKVNGAVDPATGFVFTGNSLRIPAIGLGMETPIPIVHVYYEKNGEDTNKMVWDLSTLGNYVGELEGGSYLPYEGNSVLTGHYYSAGVFKNLEHLNYEDEIVIFGNDGNKYTYAVVQKFITQPDEVYEMFQQIGDRSLTLVTCENYNLVTNEYERRQIIRAVIKSVEPYVENW